MTLILRAPDALSAPLTGTPVVQGPNPLYTTDGFSGSGTLSGRTTDAANGGTARAWSVTTGTTFTVTSGQVTTASSGVSAFAGFAMPSDSYEVFVKVPALPTTDYITLVVRHASLAVGMSINDFRCGITPTGGTVITRRLSNASTTLTTTPTVEAGDVVGLRIVTVGGVDTLSLVINGTVVWSDTVSGISSAGWAGITRATNASWVADDFGIRLIDNPALL